MEQRVRLVVGLLLLAALLTLAVPLALATAERRTTSLAGERDRQLVALAESIDAIGVRGAQEAVTRYYEVYDEPVAVVDPDGATLASAGGLDPLDSDVVVALRLALVDDATRPLPRVLPWTRADPLRSVTLTRGGEVAAVAVTRVDTSAAASDVRRTWLTLLATAIALALTALVLTRLLARWVVGPVHALEEAAVAIAHGDRGGRVLAAGPPELRRLVADFNAMLDAVERSMEHQRRLVADASHQLRNPLAAVRLRADSLGARLDPRAQQTHAALTAELERLERMLDQLLSLARAQQASTARELGVTAETDMVAFDEVVGERISVWVPAARERGQRIVVDDDLPAEAVPRDAWEQVLDVLLDNASRYAGDSAVITISAEVGALELVCVVSDDGPGMAPGAWERATERFWRGTQGSDGSGLGLAIAAELVAAAGGSLTLGPGPAGGTSVRVRVPLAVHGIEGRP